MTSNGRAVAAGGEAAAGAEDAEAAVARTVAPYRHVCPTIREASGGRLRRKIITTPSIGCRERAMPPSRIPNAATTPTGNREPTATPGRREIPKGASGGGGDGAVVADVDALAAKEPQRHRRGLRKAEPPRVAARPKTTWETSPFLPAMACGRPDRAIPVAGSKAVVMRAKTLRGARGKKNRHRNVADGGAGDVGVARAVDARPQPTAAGAVRLRRVPAVAAAVAGEVAALEASDGPVRTFPVAAATTSRRSPVAGRRMMRASNSSASRRLAKTRPHAASATCPRTTRASSKAA